MPTSVSMIALQPFTQKGRAVSKGQRFEASPVEAAALRYQGRATFAPTRGTLLTQSMAPVPDANQDAPSLSEDDTHPDAPKRRRYKRRDMTAEA
jgi:hypothetical protein